MFKMIMVRWMAAFAMLLVVQALQADPAAANDKNACMVDCIQRGSSLQSCSSQCNVVALDQRCLHDCISAGNSGSACRQSCSYTEPDALVVPKSAQTNSHAQFSSIVPAPPNMIVLPDAPTPGGAAKSTVPTGAANALMGPSTNYKCVSACRQLGYGADYCSQRCVQSPLH